MDQWDDSNTMKWAIGIIVDMMERQLNLWEWNLEKEGNPA